MCEDFLFPLQCCLKPTQLHFNPGTWTCRLTWILFLAPSQSSMVRRERWKGTDRKDVVGGRSYKNLSRTVKLFLPWTCKRCSRSTKKKGHERNCLIFCQVQRSKGNRNRKASKMVNDVWIIKKREKVKGRKKSRRSKCPRYGWSRIRNRRNT